MLGLTRRSLTALSFAAALAAATASAQDGQAGAQQGEQAGAEQTQARPTDPRMEEAQRRFAEAEQVYSAGDYAGALAEFERIYELLDGNPRRFFVLYNIGRCQEQLFQYGDALTSYQRYLDEGGADTDRAQAAREKIEDLRARLATVTVQTNVEQAEVWVDGRQVGTAPGDVVVTGGQHTIELRARGYAPGQQQIRIPARTEQTISVPLDEVGGSSGLDPLFFISGAAITAVTALVGGGFGVAALIQHGNIQSQEMSNDPMQQFRVTQAQLDSVAQTALIADILFGTAALFGVASVVLLFLTDWGGDDAAQQASIRIAPIVSPTAGGLTLQGSF